MPSPSGTPYYASQNDLTNKWGNTAIQQWSDLDGAGTINVTRVNVALLYADSIINSVFLAGGIFTVYPGSYLVFASTTNGQVLANQWSCIIAGVYLYEAKSGRDEYYQNNLEPLLKKTMHQMQAASSDTKNSMGFDALRRWPVSNAPVGYAPGSRTAFNRGYGHG